MDNHTAGKWFFRGLKQTTNCKAWISLLIINRFEGLLETQRAQGTVYPKKYAHGFVVLCFVVVMQSFIMNSHEVFIHIHQGCFAGTGAIARLPQCQWSKPDGYGKISQRITTTKHSKAKTVCIFLGIYCNKSSPLRHWGRDEMATILQPTISDAFSWKKMYEFRLKFLWSLLLMVQLARFGHCFRKWLGTDQATSHYLDNDGEFNTIMRHSGSMSCGQ